ncbi:MAG TPA: four-helix bundle copper-binding protein, partial [Patescibacteria group bacterium]|nr:four-helix bundle copper-binding protein [Patescibacteria group bacterium]
CLETCLDCYRDCQETLQYCLSKGGEHVSANHIQLVLECSKLCQLSADFMIRKSGFSGALCKLCAEMCEACADSCSKITHDAQMQTCADVCRL